MKERLQKILANATSLSRRSAEKAIAEGRVKINGEVVTKMGTTADPEKDVIVYDGGRIKPINFRLYIIFNKPRNTMVTKSDPEGRPTIWDRLPAEMKKVLNSAGRLDFDSEGLLFLTNDGELINKLTHPKGELWKTYHVKLGGVPTELELDRLRNGIKLDDGVTLPAKARIVKKTEDGNSMVEIAIREGKNRQVRRMLFRIGYMVRKLRRVEVAGIRLDSLKVGEWRYASKKEYALIKRILTA